MVLVVSRLEISLLLLLYTLVTQRLTGVPSLPPAAANISASGCERPPALAPVSAASAAEDLLSVHRLGEPQEKPVVIQANTRWRCSFSFPCFFLSAPEG